MIPYILLISIDDASLKCLDIINMKWIWQSKKAVYSNDLKSIEQAIYI